MASSILIDKNVFCSEFVGISFATASGDHHCACFRKYAISSNDKVFGRVSGPIVVAQLPALVWRKPKGWLQGQVVAFWCKLLPSMSSKMTACYRGWPFADPGRPLGPPVWVSNGHY